MYADVLCLLDEGVKENKSKSKDKNDVVNQQKAEELKGLSVIVVVQTWTCERGLPKHL